MSQSTEGKSDLPALALRLAVGFFAGLCLYFIANFRSDAPQLGFAAGEAWERFRGMAWIVATLAPLPVLFGVANLRPARLLAWSLVAAGLLALFGWLGPTPLWTGAPVVVAVGAFSLIVIYILHEFVQGAEDDRRPFARYETYFDRAWRHGFQAALALGFVAAFWVVLTLGAWLFRLIGVEAVADAVFSDEIGWTASGLAFALGVHLTDADAGLTRGARQIGLALLSWLAVLMTLILSAFLLTLPFTGLEPLWDTKRATVLLLNAAATMILLVNAAYQAGEGPRSRILRAIVRFSAFPLAGIVALAALGLFLRIGQYGLTPARVVAFAELLIVAVYALGYVAAAVKPGPWLALVKPVNIGAAAFVAATLAALMTPIADPARLSVSDQVSRLESGRVEPDDFDFGFLADPRAGKYGERALARLAEKSGSERDDRIALLAKNPGSRDYWTARSEQSMNRRRDALRMIDGGELPDAALIPPTGEDPIGGCVDAKAAADEAARLAEEADRRRARLGGAGETRIEPAVQLPADGRCPARRLDLDGDGDQDLLVWTTGGARGQGVLSFAAILDEGSGWRAAGFVGWRDHRESDFAIRTARDLSDEDRYASYEAAFAAAAVVPPLADDLLVDGERLRLIPARESFTGEELAAAITARDGRSVPEILREHRAFDNPAAACAAARRDTDGAPFSQCRSFYADLDGDGAEEFVLLSAHGTHGVEATAYRLEETAWRAFASGAALFESAKATDPAEDTLLFDPWEVAIQNRRLDEARPTPAFMNDLEINGARVRFSYADPDPAGPGR